MSEKTVYPFIKEALDKRERENRLRELHPITPGKGMTVRKNGRELINFCSNDYLGLSRHPEVIARSQEFAGKYGAGSGASRLVSGTFDIHRELEEKLAGALGREAALLFSSGFQANSSLIGTLGSRHSLIIGDALSHNSLLQGGLLSRAAFRRFRHNDLDELEMQLDRAQSERYDRVLVVTETIFSMDGDRSDVERINALCEEYGAMLFVDDAHAIGVWGRRGMGLVNGLDGVDIVLGTCGKAFGSFGAFVGCTSEMKRFLINFCPGFIYTTALPPAVTGAIEAALELIPEMEDERSAYRQKTETFREALQEIGFDTGASESQIVPVITGDDRKTLQLSGWLEEQGILATAIRPPTVPQGGARIRFTLSLAHTDEQINYLLEKLQEWKNGEN